MAAEVSQWLPNASAAAANVHVVSCRGQVQGVRSGGGTGGWPGYGLFLATKRFTMDGVTSTTRAPVA